MKDLTLLLEKLLLVLSKFENILILESPTKQPSACIHEPFTQDTNVLKYKPEKTDLILFNGTGVVKIDEVIAPFCVKCGVKLKASSWVRAEIDNAT